jgi:ketosteroid isomerase-like protein
MCVASIRNPSKSFSYSLSQIRARQDKGKALEEKEIRILPPMPSQHDYRHAAAACITLRQLNPPVMNWLKKFWKALTEPLPARVTPERASRPKFAEHVDETMSNFTPRAQQVLALARREAERPMIGMHRTFLLLALVASLVASCASVHTTDLRADYRDEQAQIERRLHEIIDAAEKKDLPRLDSYHFYGPKFTKFAEQLGRLDAAAAREGEHVGLAAINGLAIRAEDLKIDVFGGVAIATFIASSSFKSETGIVEKEARATLVFVNERGAWKITHEHFSPFKSNL